jgi:hypothetical protein
LPLIRSYSLFVMDWYSQTFSILTKILKPINKSTRPFDARF